MQGWRVIFDYFGLELTPERFCKDLSRTKLNQTRNMVMRYHVLAAARTRAQLPADCTGGCQYDTLAGGKNLVDKLTVALDEVVGTYVIGGSNDDYGDFQPGRIDIRINGRVSSPAF